MSLKDDFKDDLPGGSRLVSPDESARQQPTLAAVSEWQRGVEDAAAGIRAAANKQPALMNPDTMRHIADNLELWAHHQQFLRNQVARERQPDSDAEADERYAQEASTQDEQSPPVETPQEK